MTEKSLNTKSYVIVGMSGGVDSSVATLLLKQQGYRVEGLFMKNWEEDDNSSCPAGQDFTDAKVISAKLGIRLHTINFSKEYWDQVFAYFLDEYKAGRTPNPDVLCNKEIKFKCFLDHAIKLGADYIATGHYARKNFENNHWQLLKGIDPEKDQSYFLYLLNQLQLAKTLFPVGELTKTKVRELAQQIGFRNYNKKGSTGICFIGERNFKKFLSQYLPAQLGNIETTEGKIIGQHDGLMYYTIGQRQGIGVGGIKQAKESPWYVIHKDLKRNALIISQDENLLLRDSLTADQLHFIAEEIPHAPFSCQAKIRYRQKDQACLIEKIENDVAYIKFSDSQRAITPGQSIVFYKNDICLGGGIIR